MTNILEKETQALIAEWNAVKPTIVGGFKSCVKPACQFLMNALDVFVLAVEPLILSGSDKKAAVLTAIALTYDSIITPILPIYFRPFNSQIKAFVVMTLASVMIDFIVKQYNRMGGIPVNNNV